MSSDGLTHLDEEGRARMVDVGEKDVTRREAVASARVRMAAETMRVLVSGTAPKGDVLATARIAGIQAAKRTAELIPMCHPLRLTSVSIALDPHEDGVHLDIRATVRALDRTGVEMEALTAASVAALTVYDMLKAIDRRMVIEEVALLEKHGGKSGDFVR